MTCKAKKPVACFQQDLASLEIGRCCGSSPKQAVVITNHRPVRKDNRHPTIDASLTDLGPGHAPRRGDPANQMAHPGRGDASDTNRLGERMGSGSSGHDSTASWKLTRSSA
jgi:hypothetical protein